MPQIWEAFLVCAVHKMGQIKWFSSWYGATVEPSHLLNRVIQNQQKLQIFAFEVYSQVLSHQLLKSIIKMHKLPSIRTTSLYHNENSSIWSVPIRIQHSPKYFFTRCDVENSEIQTQRSTLKYNKHFISICSFSQIKCGDFAVSRDTHLIWKIFSFKLLWFLYMFSIEKKNFCQNNWIRN